MSFMFQMRSSNGPNKWDKIDKLRKKFKRDNKISSIDIIVYSLSELDLDKLNDMYNNE